MDIVFNYRKTTIEPKVFALIVSSKMGQRLHLGVHFTLEEAYAAARAEMNSLGVHGASEAVNIDLWNTLPGDTVLNKLIDTGAPQVQPSLILPGIDLVPMNTVPTNGLNNLPPVEEEKEPESVETHIKNMRDSKNILMKKLIDEGDLSQVEKAKSLLGTYSKNYVVKAIEDKKNSESNKI